VERRTIDILLTSLGAVMVMALVVLGILAMVGANFAKSQVRQQLLAEKVFFPPKGSEALNPKEFPGLQQYAGQAVDDGPKAKAYANEFIAVHLRGGAGGKTYSEVSAAALKAPQDEQLQQQAQTLFRGETLRGLLLLGGYVPWTEGEIAQWSAIALFVGAAIMLVLVLLGLLQIMRHHRGGPRAEPSVERVS
jgi:hypothetical protein